MYSGLSDREARCRPHFPHFALLWLRFRQKGMSPVEETLLGPDTAVLALVI